MYRFFVFIIYEKYTTIPSLQSAGLGQSNILTPQTYFFALVNRKLLTLFNLLRTQVNNPVFHYKIIIILFDRFLHRKLAIFGISVDYGFTLSYEFKNVQQIYDSAVRNISPDQKGRKYQLVFGKASVHKSFSTKYLITLYTQ